MDILNEETVLSHGLPGKVEAEEQNKNDILCSNSGEEEEEGGTNTLTTASSYLNGRWTFDEHVRFLKGCILYGNNWKKVELYVKSRTSSQIRSHAQKFLIKLNKKYKVDLVPNFPHSQKYIKNTKHKLSKPTIDEVFENLSKPEIDMESVEKVILNIFFWNGTNGMDLKTKRGAEMFRKNRNITIPDIENLEFKKKIFSCEKIPKTSPLKTQIISFLKSNEADEFNKMMMWINSDNTKIKNLIKSICLSLNIVPTLNNNNSSSNFTSINNNYFSNVFTAYTNPALPYQTNYANYFDTA